MERNKIQGILKKYHLRPKKYLGQNFLIDEKVLKETIKTAKLRPDETILEIGPGFGALTRKLAKRAGKVIAIEKDRNLVKILKEELRNFKNIKIIRGDILKIQISNLKSQKYKIVANLPYYITSPVIRKFLENKNPPKLMVLTIQKEVAERICAAPPKISILAVTVQFYSRPEIIKIVKKESFWPAPRVDSAIIKIIPRKSASKESLRVNPLLFFKIVKAGFSSPRKQLKNNFKKIFGKNAEEILKKSEIDSARRAETLSVNDWLKIYNKALLL